jgi:hypothetical protein
LETDVKSGDRRRYSWDWSVSLEDLTYDRGLRVLALAERELGLPGRLCDPGVSCLLYGDDATTAIILDAVADDKPDTVGGQLAADILAWRHDVRSAEILYEQPELVMSVYVEHGSEADAFARLCGVLMKHDCRPAGVFRIFDGDDSFDRAPDISGILTDPEMPEHGSLALIRGAEVRKRVIEAGFYTREFTRVTVRYGIKETAGRHTLEVVLRNPMSATSPARWAPDDRALAHRFTQWSKILFQDACEELNPLYGSIELYETLLPPSLVGCSEFGISNLFISYRLLDAAPTAERTLGTHFTDGEISHWESGLFFSSWNPPELDHSPFWDPERDFPCEVETVLAEALARHQELGILACARRTLVGNETEAIRSPSHRPWAVDFPGMTRDQAVRLLALCRCELGLQGHVIDPHEFFRLLLNEGAARYLRDSLSRSTTGGPAAGLIEELNEWVRNALG